MATEIFTDDVQILGTEDEVQLQVQGTDGQTAPLQTWQDHTGAVQARMTAEGRLQVGELGMSTPDALLEANRETSSVLPERGFHSLGRINAALSSAIAWLVGELELLGTGDLSGIQRLLRAVLTHASTGDSSEAEVRAADFEVINQSGDEFYPLGKAVVLEADLDNQAGAFLDEGRGLSVRLQNGTGAEIGTFKAMEVQAPVNAGTISTLIGLDIADMNEGTDNYALRTGAGKVQFGELGTGLVKANASGLLSNAVAGTDFDIPMQGATDTLDGEAGVVPQPLAGDEDKFLRADGTWAEPATGASGIIGADGIAFVNPLLKTWTALNHGSGAYDAANNQRISIFEEGNGSLNIRGYHTPIPSGGTPYFIRMHVKYLLGMGSVTGVTWGFRQSSDGKLALAYYYYSTGLPYSLVSGKWNSPTALLANYVTWLNQVIGDANWLGLEDDGTNRILKISDDGINWRVLHSVSRTDFLTADQIVFGVVLSTNSNFDIVASLLSYEEL